MVAAVAVPGTATANATTKIWKNYGSNLCLGVADGKMQDGSTYVNHLQGYCPDLKFTGFIWRLQAGDTKVCEFENTFSVLQSGQSCTLGKFEPTTGKQALSAPVQWDANREQVRPRN